jgi:hypothetical protein
VERSKILTLEDWYDLLSRFVFGSNVRQYTILKHKKYVKEYYDARPSRKMKILSLHGREPSEEELSIIRLVEAERWYGESPVNIPELYGRYGTSLSRYLRNE